MVYERSWFGTAAGVSSCRRSWLVGGGSSLLGMGLGVLTLRGSAALNARGNAAKPQNATLMWQQLDSGTTYWTHGYYLAKPGPVTVTSR